MGYKISRQDCDSAKVRKNKLRRGCHNWQEFVPPLWRAYGGSIFCFCKRWLRTLKNQHIALLLLFGILHMEKNVYKPPQGLKWQTNQISSCITHSHFLLGLYHILYHIFLYFRNRITYFQVFCKEGSTQQTALHKSCKREVSSVRRQTHTGKQDLLDTKGGKTSGSLG